MKTFSWFIVFLISVCCYGCALLVPPPYHHSKTRIVKDENGKVVQSEYSRTTRGFSDKIEEDATSWAEADQQTRRDYSAGFKKESGEQIQTENVNLASKEIEYISDGTEGEENLPFLSGIAENASQEDATLKFYKNGKRFEKSFYIPRGKTQDIILPSYGTWQPVWFSNGQQVSAESLLLKKGCQIVEGGSAYGWRTKLNYIPRHRDRRW